MKKILVIFVIFLSVISCLNMESKKELNYHSHKGYAHTHLKIMEKNSDMLKAEVVIMGQSKEIIELSKKGNNEYSNEKVNFKYLDNGDIELNFLGQKIVLYQLYYTNTQGFGHKVYKDSHEGHSH